MFCGYFYFQIMTVGKAVMSFFVSFCGRGEWLVYCTYVISAILWGSGIDRFVIFKLVGVISVFALLVYHDAYVLGFNGEIFFLSHSLLISVSQRLFQFCRCSFSVSQYFDFLFFANTFITSTYTEQLTSAWDENLRKASLPAFMSLSMF